MFLLFLVVWAAGAFSPRDDVTAPLTTRIAGLEKQLRDLAARPQPAAADPRAVADLGGRVAAAEQAMSRLAGLDSRLGKAEQGLAKAEQAAAAPPAAQTDQALTARVAALEAAVRPLAELGPRSMLRALLRATRSRAPMRRSRPRRRMPRLRRRRPPITRRSRRWPRASPRWSRRSNRPKRASPRRPAPTRPDVSRSSRSRCVRPIERGDPFAQELAAVRPLVSDAKGAWLRSSRSPRPACRARPRSHANCLR